MTAKNLWRVLVCLLAVATVAFFAACGDDQEACPYGDEANCQYDGDNLVDCTTDNAATQCTSGFTCLDEGGSGEPVAAGATGICATNSAMTTELDLQLPGINWGDVDKKA